MKKEKIINFINDFTRSINVQIAAVLGVYLLLCIISIISTPYKGDIIMYGYFAGIYIILPLIIMFLMHRFVYFISTHWAKKSFYKKIRIPNICFYILFDAIFAFFAAAPTKILYKPIAVAILVTILILMLPKKIKDIITNTIIMFFFALTAIIYIILFVFYLYLILLL